MFYGIHRGTFLSRWHFIHREEIWLLQDKEGIIVGAKSRNGREGTEYTAAVERTTINGNRDILSIVTEGKEYI